MRFSSGGTGVFQLTAARRRLPVRPAMVLFTPSFNSQPLEGGCNGYATFRGANEFQLTAARRRLPRRGGWAGFVY